MGRRSVVGRKPSFLKRKREEEQVSRLTLVSMMKEDKAAYNRTDTTSLSNCQDAVSEHIHIVWTIDYRKQKLVGTATHTIKVLKSGTAFVSFDSSDLNVTNATVDGKDVEVVADKKHAALGTKLTVPLPESRRNAGHTVTVSFTYATSPTASAIQWAEAAATADKRYPYVYTQVRDSRCLALLRFVNMCSNPAPSPIVASI